MSLHVNEKSGDKEVELAIGETLTVTLVENPTTGYLWRFASTGAPVCELLDDNFEPGKDGPGSSGVHHWRFRAHAAGTGLIELELSRSWHSTVPIRTFALTAHVSASEAAAYADATA